MTTGHFVAFSDLPSLCYPGAHQFHDTGREVISCFLCEHFDIDDLAALAVWNPERSVTYIAGLLTEDRTEQFFFSSKFSFTFGCDLPNKYVARFDICADPDDSFFVQVTQAIFPDIRDVPRNLFRA